MASSLHWLFLSLCACLQVVESAKRAKYCVIGAGAAGLQLGQNFMNAGVDYATFERGAHAGMFFQHYPIHRQLISVNKRSTRSNAKEFNLRHDWNSLLHFKGAPFTERSEEYFPSADVLVEYLRDISKEQDGNIHYNHQVSTVSHSKDDSGGFDVVINDLSENPAETPVELRTGNSIPRLEEGKQVTWHCGKVIGATGLWKPYTPKGNWMRGLDHAVGYDELTPWNGKAFENLSVLILGNGNAAFETADAMRNWASEIGIFGRRAERLARESHYVGDIRGHRLTSIDSLELKTLDDVFYSPEEIASKLELMPCESPGADRGTAGQGWPQGAEADRELKGFKGRKPTCIISDYDTEDFLIADYDLENTEVTEAISKWKGHMTVRRPSADLTRWNKWGVKKYGDVLLDAAGMPDIHNTTVLTMKKEAVRELAATSAEFRKALPGLLATTQGLWLAHASFRKPVDVVVKALGWRIEADPFKPVGVLLDSNEKYPKMDACYRAQNKDGGILPGIYWAGTITHGFDKFRFGSAGGFIHGFRYTAESLFHCLMHEEGKPLWEGSKHVFSWDPPESTCKNTDGSQVCTSDSASDAVPKKAKESAGRARKALEQTPRWSHLMMRANEASGPYQMSCGALMDGIVYNKTARTATYYENIPLDVFEGNFINTTRLVLQLRYGQGANYYAEPELGAPSGLRSGVLAFGSKYLHPVFMFAQPEVPLINSTRLHLIEDRWTDFAGREEVLGAHNFFKTVEAAAWSGSKPPRFHEHLDRLRLDCSHHYEEH